MRTQVAIVGGGPSGLLLSHLLHLQGIDSVVLEQRSRNYVEARIRAGVLEQGTVELLTEVGLGDRLRREGLVHDGTQLYFGGALHRIDFHALTGKRVTVYGQTEIQKDLGDARDRAGGAVIHEAEDIAIEGIEGDAPLVRYRKDGVDDALRCDFVAGCDGFHGVSRATIPAAVLKTYERAYPFAWLGILADVPPARDELIYSAHDRGFALASMRSATRSRYYFQSSVGENIEDWSDDRIWEELKIRFGPEVAATMQTGPSIEKSVAPLRSFVAEPMRFGRLMLAGDAAHIVPPTGAKGLNLAVADVRVLSRALVAWFKQGRGDLVESYSATCLSRVWKAERFSWWLTTLMHRLHDPASFERRIQLAELEYIVGSKAASTALAENYVGLPF